MCMEEELEKEEQNNDKGTYCPRCGLRSYDDPCPNCGAPMVNKEDDEEEEYDWRETKR